MTDEQKLKELAWLLYKWNSKEISGDELGNAIWKLYEKEALELWNNPLTKLLVD